MRNGEILGEMKFPIIEIDWDRVNLEIEQFVAAHGGKTPYVFVNEDTLRVMRAQYAYGFEAVPKQDSKYGYQIRGCPVFVNNMLKFGIVELR